MSKFRSLADFLGDPDGNPLETAEVTAGTSERDFSLEKLTGKEFADAILNSSIFRRYIVHSLTLGTLPPAVITRLMDYAPGWGKPPDKLEIRNVTDDVDEMSAEECEREALRLIGMAKQLRKIESTDEDASSIH